MKQFLAPFLTTVFLVGCAQVFVKSEVELGSDLNLENNFAKAVQIVDSKMNEFGGECRHRFADRNYYSCNVSGFGEVSDIVIGVDKRGRSFVAVQSLGSAYFVPSKERLKDGFLPVKGHLEVEKWLFSSFSELNPLKKARIFSSRDVEIEFD